VADLDVVRSAVADEVLAPGGRGRIAARTRILVPPHGGALEEALRDDEVEIAVAVHVGDLHVGREPSSGWDDREASPLRIAVPVEPVPIPAAPDDDIGEAVAVEVSDAFAVGLERRIRVDELVLEWQRPVSPGKRREKTRKHPGQVGESSGA